MIRFVKMRYEFADMDRHTVPGVLAYKNGHMVANLMGLWEELEGEGTEELGEALERCLRR